MLYHLIPTILHLTTSTLKTKELPFRSSSFLFQRIQTSYFFFSLTRAALPCLPLM